MPMTAWSEHWRNVRRKFGWWIWLMFGWWSFFAFVVTAWFSANYSDHKKTGFSLLFGVVACILGALSLGCFLVAVIDFIQSVWSGVGRLMKWASKG